ncbi:hypothetical protein BH11MYX1_BH11MYX1_28580 [soil metagenome]
MVRTRIVVVSSLLALASGLASCLGGGDEAPAGTDSGVPAGPPEAVAATACTTALAITGVTATGAQTGNPAGYAIDGDLATRWSEQGVGAAITADLGGTRAVCGVALAWYQGNARTNQFAVAFSTDGISFTTVATATSSGTTTALEPTTVTPGTARYVRVTFAGNSVNDWASLTELRLTGTTGFVHPGVLVSGAQLALVKSKIIAGATPWKTSYNELLANKYVRSGWTASPRATIECGSFNNPNFGCTQEFDDANAAYSNALVWAYTGQTKYADVAIAILDAYATTVTAHTNSNAPLETGWAAERFVRAAEIVRWTSTRWSAARVNAFATLMRNVYLPLVRNGWPSGNGNWDLTMLDATVSIAVFTDDRSTFDAAIAKWKLRVPAYIHLTSDGALPIRPSGTSAYASAQAVLALWSWPTTGSGTSATPTYPLPNGLAQETCRDFGHVSMGLTSMIDTAETAWIQGIDLYGYADVANRITQTLELHAKYLNGTTIPSTLCGGEGAYRANVGLLAGTPAASALNFEVGYNHYANRKGASLPQTRQSLLTIDANGSAYRNKVGQTAAYENLTNAEK